MRLGFILTMNIVVSWTHTLQPSPAKQSSRTTGNLWQKKAEMQRGSKRLPSKLHSYRINTATEEGLHFPGPTQTYFPHFAWCVPYIQHELQCTLVSQNNLLEDTLSQALLSQKTHHMLAAHQRGPTSHLLQRKRTISMASSVHPVLTCRVRSLSTRAAVFRGTGKKSSLAAYTE